jgi:integrase/recombinase XerD
MSSFTQFITERRYVKNISPATVRWYEDVFKAFGRHLDITSAQTFRRSTMEGVKALLERGVKPISVRSWLTGIRAYGYWLHQEGFLSDKPKIELLRCEQKVIQTLSARQVQALIQFKPKGRNQTRAHTIALVLLDTGLRISECLGLSQEDIDFDNLILRVKGKGGKHRLVPFTLELRKHLFRYLERLAINARSNLAFGTARGTPLTPRNLQRDFKEVCRKAGVVGVRTSPHTFRHSFAVGYLRAGGNLFYLSKILGHTSVKTTERYLQSLGIEDLQKAHNGLSLLAR